MQGGGGTGLAGVRRVFRYPGALGFGESLHNIALALILVVLAALCTSVGLVRETAAAGAS